MIKVIGWEVGSLYEPTHSTICNIVIK